MAVKTVTIGELRAVLHPSEQRTYRDAPFDEAFRNDLASESCRDAGGLSRTKQRQSKDECSRYVTVMGSAKVRFRFT